MCFVSFLGKSVWGRAGSAHNTRMSLSITKKKQSYCLNTQPCLFWQTCMLDTLAKSETPLYSFKFNGMAEYCIAMCYPFYNNVTYFPIY